MPIRIVIESAPKRTFASVLDWPGWSRSGRTREEAMDALVAYGDRYARVVRRAGLRLPSSRTVEHLSVVEELTGGSGTEFGVPSVAAADEAEPVTESQLRRLTRLLRAAWDELDAVVSDVGNASLRTGPRGGGRQLPAVLDHVRDAESAYLGQLGARPPPSGDASAIRAAFLDALTARVRGRPIENARRTKRPWSPRYAVRRAAWHVLDHAWEIEDRAER